MDRACKLERCVCVQNDATTDTDASGFDQIQNGIMQVMAAYVSWTAHQYQ